MNCADLAALMVLFETLYDKYYLHYNVRIQEFRDTISQEAAFVALPLLRQKEIFCKMLDLNQLYVNAAEMHDAQYALSEADKAATADFYKK